MLDIIVSFFTAYLDPETGHFELDIRKIASKYMKTWFLIDVLSIIPWESMNA